MRPTDPPDLNRPILSDELRSKIAKYSVAKGGNYERRVAKIIAGHFGWEWTTAFLRTKRSVDGKQVHGDLKPIDDMAVAWKDSGFGTIECKCQKGWSLDQVFKRPEKSVVYEWWVKSKDDTKNDNTVLFFTKPGVTDYVMFRSARTRPPYTQLFFVAGGYAFRILTLKDFLKEFFPQVSFDPTKHSATGDPVE